MSVRSLVGVSIAAAVMGVLIPSGFAQSPPSYKVTKTIPLGTPDRWDYLTFDPDSHRVFVAHGDRVSVVDGRNGTILGQVEGFPGGTHGIAIWKTINRGYTDDGKAGVAVAFDLTTLQRVKTIPAVVDADGIVLDPKSNHLFVINGSSGSVTVIDPATDAAIKTIDVGGDLEFAAADGAGKLYVDGAERKEIVRIDTKSDQVDARWPIPNCTSPHGIAIDPPARRLFASCVNKVLVVVDTETGATVSTLPIGARTDAAAFDAKRKLIFSSNGEGSLSVIAEKDPNTFVSLGTIPTVLGARTMTLDPESGRIYLVAADYTINDKVDPSDIRHRYVVTPGTAKLMFLDPTPTR